MLDADVERDTVLHEVAEVDKEDVCDGLRVRVPTGVRVTEIEALTDAVTVHDDVAREEGEPEIDPVAEGEHDEGCFVNPYVGHTDAQSQSVQEVEPFTEEKEPGGQSVQFGAPAAEKEPAIHAVGLIEESGQ